MNDVVATIRRVTAKVDCLGIVHFTDFYDEDWDDHRKDGPKETIYDVYRRHTVENLGPRTQEDLKGSAGVFSRLLTQL